jgi:ornithine cyclodeaminase/alanine dehydrogenase-like protein (mu-crystallin family)
MENDGKPIGFINAEELTAFRTALASSLLITRRSKVKTVTVFGAGKQAYVAMSGAVFRLKLD